ncbi:MAG: hypothetical protein KDI49_19275, partial [Gammaproteobacteria bacterium]|nr:hypothetical protein [Gammaproteobacteria bacterium]
MNHPRHDPRALALAAMEQISVTPTGMVEFRAGGKLAIIGGGEAVAAAGRASPPLQAQVLLTAANKESAGSGVQVDSGSLTLEGYLGAFRIMFREAGKP